MTGEEFLAKVQSINEITNISWEVQGDDPLDPREVKVVIIADGEEISVVFPNPCSETKWAFNRFASLALIINKLMNQLNNDFTTCADDDLTFAVNYARKQLDT